VVNQGRDPRLSLDVREALEVLGPLRFLVDHGVDRLVLEGEHERDQVGLPILAHGPQPGHPGLRESPPGLTRIHTRRIGHGAALASNVPSRREGLDQTVHEPWNGRAVRIVIRVELAHGHGGERRVRNRGVILEGGSRSRHVDRGPLSVEERGDTVVIIGIDPHKASHTATALSPATNTAASSLRIDATFAGYRQLLRWGRTFPERQWAIENAHGLGCHLAQWLVARGETVLDVRTTATARVRELSRGGRRKNDVIDASAAASVAARQGDTSPVLAEDATTVFALLEERRANLAAQRVRLVNQLHALLRDLVPGGARAALTAEAAAALLRSVRPASPAERTRKELARELVHEIRGVDARLAQTARRMSEALAAHGTRLLQVQGVGPVLAVRLLGRAGRATRFRSTAAFANYAGVAPIEVASGD